MPLTQRPPTADEVEYLKSQGIDPEGALINVPDQQAQQGDDSSKPSIAASIARTAHARGGGWAAGGVGALQGAKYGAMLGAAVPGAGETGISELAGGVLGGAVGGIAGSMGGNRIQDWLEGDQKAKEVNEAYEQAKEAHPYVVGATDIAGSALASGGWPSIANLGKAGEQLLGRNAVDAGTLASIESEGAASPLAQDYAEKMAAQRGAREAISKIAMNAVINPAINTGIGLAMGQGLPSAGDLASQFAGGALFSESSAYGKWLSGHGSKVSEPAPETTTKPIGETTTDSGPTTLYTQKDADGNYSLTDADVKKAYKTDIKPPPSADALGQMTTAQQLFAKRNYVNDNAIPVEQMRQALHAKELADNPPTTEPADKTPEATAPVSEVPPVVEQPSNLTDSNKIQPAASTSDIIPDVTANGTEKPEEQVSDTDRLLAQKEAQDKADEQNQQDQQDKTNPEIARLSELIDASGQRFLDRHELVEYNQLDAKHNASNDQIDIDKYLRQSNQPTSTDLLKPVVSDLTNAAKTRRLALDEQGKQQAVEGEALAQRMRESAQRAADYPSAQTELAKQRAQEDIDAYRKKVGNLQGRMQDDLSKTPSLDAWRNKWKADTSGQVNDFVSAIGQHGWNALIDTIYHSIKAGKAIHEAIKDGINYLKANHPNAKYDENALTQHLTKITNDNPSIGKPVTLNQKSMGPIGKGFRSVVDSVRDIAHPLATKLSDALKMTAATRDERTGKTFNKIATVADKYGFTKQDDAALQRISKWENLNKQSAPQSMFDSRAQVAVYNAERQVHAESGQHRIDIREPVYRDGNPTQLKQLPWQHATTLDPKVADLYRAATDKAGIAKMDKIFLDNSVAHGMTPEKAAANLSRFKDALQGHMKGKAPSLQEFNGARMMHGVALPEEFQTKGWMKNQETYYKRMALDNAFYQHMESNPDVMSALGAKKDAWGKDLPIAKGDTLANNPTVQSALNHFQGQMHSPTMKNEASLSNFITTLFVSNPAIEMHKIASNQINGPVMLADNPLHAARILTHMVSHFQSGIQHATENGVVKMTARSLSDFFENGASFADRMSAASHAIRQLSSLGGRTDRLNVGLLQSGFEYGLRDAVKSAERGNITKQQLLKKLDPTYIVGKQYDDAGISKLASQMTAYTQGTHDIRTMPAWMMADTEIGGFFKLAHWSVGQTNRFMSDVWTPLRKGDPKPFIMALTGSVVGGYLIKQLREEMQGKRGELPSLREIANSDPSMRGNKGLIAYNAIAACQYAGFGGLLSQILKFPLDRIYKNAPQGEVFPMDEVAYDLATSIGKLTTAAANDPKFDWIEGLKALTTHVLQSDIQLSRVAYNQGINSGLITGTPAEKKMLSDKLGQLRRFDMVEHLPYAEQDGASEGNPYMDMSQKSFKRTQDIGQAVKMLPGLVSNIIQQYKGQPDIMMSKLEALKENQYDTMPSPAKFPIEFSNYMKYLVKEQGPQAAQAAMMDYYKHKAINSAKSSMVP